MSIEGRLAGPRSGSSRSATLSISVVTVSESTGSSGIGSMRLITQTCADPCLFHAKRAPARQCAGAPRECVLVLRVAVGRKVGQVAEGVRAVATVAEAEALDVARLGQAELGGELALV